MGEKNISLDLLTVEKVVHNQILSSIWKFMGATALGFVKATFNKLLNLFDD